jgi:aminoglycoside phosphotransferase family enzyme
MTPNTAPVATTVQAETTDRDTSATVTLESKVAFLRLPSAFSTSAYRVEAIETHMSWIFLADGFAYKLKKPVRQEFLDFSTLEARRFYCEEEVRLNRRLAPDVYLGVVALCLDAQGHLQLGGKGTVIDWLVKMRRLPTQHMLDFSIQHGAATADDIRRVAVRLADFYRTCAPADITPTAYRERFQQQILSTMNELCLPAYGLPIGLVQGICQAQVAFLWDLGKLLEDRVRAKKIVEGHGDLRPEHISLEQNIAIIDCLEFSLQLRMVDVVDELAFLELECERLGAENLGNTLIRTYNELSGDLQNPALIFFYKSCRATMRALIAIRHLNEEKFRYSPQWPRRARDYLELARRHAAHCRGIFDDGTPDPFIIPASP